MSNDDVLDVGGVVGGHLCFSTYNWGSKIRESQHQDLVMVTDVLDVRGMLGFLFASALKTEAQDQRILALGSHHEQWLCPGCWRNVGVHLCFSTYNWGSRSGTLSIRLLPSAVRSWILGLHSYFIEQYHMCYSNHHLPELVRSVRFIFAQHLQQRPLCVFVCDLVLHNVNQIWRIIEHNSHIKRLVFLLHMYIWSSESFHQHCNVFLNTDCSC